MVNRRLLICALTLLLFGGNAAVVQLVAWGSMLAERAQRMEWSVAIASTFDGSAPCHMCRAAESLRQDEAPSMPLKVVKLVKKAEAPPLAVTTTLLTGGWIRILPPWSSTVRPARDAAAPEPPPPRAL